MLDRRGENPCVSSADDLDSARILIIAAADGWLVKLETSYFLRLDIVHNPTVFFILNGSGLTVVFG